MPSLQDLHAFAVVLHCFCRWNSSAKAWHPSSELWNAVLAHPPPFS